MKRNYKYITSALVLSAIFATSLSMPVFADGEKCAILLSAFCDGNLGGLLALIINILTAGIVIAGTVGIIWTGRIILTARDNQADVEKAKQRMSQIVLGFAVWAVAYAGAGFFIPGFYGSLTAPDVTGLFFARTESPDLEDLSKIKPNYDDPAPVKPGSPVAPADPSDPTPSDPTPSDPTPSDPSDPTPTDPDPPSGTSCSDYGVGSGTTYHTQYNDSTQWKGGSCPNCTIANSGCPMVAILNAIIRVTNCKLTKQMFAKHMKEYTNNFTSRKGLFNSDSSWSNKGGDIVNHYANYYKVNIKEISKSRVKAALEAGHAVVARGQSSNDNNRVFSSGGHYVAFVGISGNTVAVKNPARSKFSSVSLETATAYATQYWEISK